MTSFGNKVFAGIIKVRIEWKSYWIMLSKYTVNTRVKRTHRDPKKMEAEIGVMCLKAKKHQSLLDTTRK